MNVAEKPAGQGATAPWPDSLPPLSMTPEAQGKWSALLTDLAPRLVAPTGEAGQLFARAVAALAAERRAEPVFARRPAWLDDHKLARLRAEAATAEIAPDATRRVAFGRIGREALRLVLSSGVRAWAGELLDLPIGRYASATYITYEHDEWAPAASPLHIDVSQYEINCLVGVHHERPPGRSPSVLRLFDRGPEPRDIELEPGSAVLFQASRTPHSRTALGPGERLVVLSIGLSIAPAPSTSPEPSPAP